MAVLEGDAAPGEPLANVPGSEAADAAPAGRERARRLLRQAEDAEARGERETATRLRRRALVNQPDLEEAALALIERAASDKDWLRWSLLQQRRFRWAESGRERGELAREIARIERWELGNPGGAREWLLRGAAEAPDCAVVREDLIELERLRGDETALLQSLQTLIQLRGQDVPVALLLEVAERLAQRGDRSQALELLERAGRLDPDNTDALDALVDMLRELEHHPELADALERRAGLAEPVPRAALLLELGELLETQLFHFDAALDAYARAVETDPECRAAADAAEALRVRMEGGSSEDREIRVRAAEALARCQRDFEASADRDRLAVLAREIERLCALCGEPEAALPWLERWVRAAPEEPKALRALARVQERNGETDALLETLQRLDRLLEPESQLPLRRRLAALYLQRGRFAEAEECFAAALQLDPGDPIALEGRADALRHEPDRREELATALTALAEQQPESARAQTWLEVAEIWQSRGDLASAAEVLARAESSEGATSEVADRVDELLAQTGQHEALLARLEARQEQWEAGSAQSVSIDLRRAKLLLEPLGRPSEASELYRRVLEHAPRSPEATAGLERALRADVDPAGLAEFLAEQAAQTEAPAERDRLRFEHAVLLEDLERWTEALETFLELGEQSQEQEIAQSARLRAEALLEQHERWSELRELLTQRLESADGDEAAELLERLAQLCARRLDDPAQACAHLERLAELDATRADVWQQLAGLYEQDGRSEDWARALEAELACDPEPARELALRSKLADLYAAELGQPERVRGHYERVLELNPGHSAAGEYLASHYRREERYPELIALLEARLAHSDAQSDADPHRLDRRTSLRLQIAELREGQLDDLEGAISALEVALDEVGAVPRVAEPLAAAYRRAGYDDDLIELCGRAAAEAIEPSERAAWHVRRGDGELARENEESAAEAYRLALRERPGDRAVEASLRELYRSLDKRGPLAELLEAELEHLAGAAEIPVRLELVELSREGSRATALRHARRILELAPRHEEAYRAAQDLCESDEERLPLVEQRRAAARSETERRAADLVRARLLARGLGRVDEAIDVLRALLAAEPGGASAREIRRELAPLLESQGRFAEWLDVWAVLCREASAEERRERLERGAEVAWDRVSPEAALPWLERLRSEGCDEPALLARISHANRQLGRETALLRSLEQEAQVSADPAHARRCHLERAHLLRASGHGGRALAALADAGPSPETLELREAIECELGLHAQRAVTLEARLALSGADPALHRQLAELYADELARPEEALRHLEAALAYAGGGGERIRALRRTAELEWHLHRFARWAERCEEELAALDPAPVFDERRLELHRELGLAYAERLARPDLALGHLRAVLDSHQVETLCGDDRERIECRALALLRSSGQRAELERRLGARLERAGGDCGEWIELARLREEVLQRLAPARDAYRRALETAADPDSKLEALRGLRRTAQQLGAWSEVAEALDAEVEFASDPAERGALLRALGDLAWHRLDSTTRASRFYAAALESNSEDFAALRALQRLMESMEDWRGALDLYDSEAQTLGDTNPTRLREIWLRVAELARERENDLPRARWALERAAELAPLDPERLRDLAELQDATGDREAFAENLARWCDGDDSAATAADHLRVAGVHEELGHLGAAIERVEIALSVEPEHTGAWEMAARLRAADGDARGSAEALRRAAEHLDSGPAVLRLLEAAEKLDEAEAAHELLEHATHRAPDSARAQAALARSAAGLGRDAQTENAAAAALEVGAESLDPAEAALVARLGGEAAARRGRFDAAAGLFAESLRLEPDGPDALAGQARALIELGDARAAREVLERRLAHPQPDPSRALHQALLGRCLEQTGQLDEALAAYAEALSEDPLQDEALGARARIFEAQDRFEVGIGAIERWARAAPDGASRAERLMRAAEWELRRGDCEDAALAHLRQLVAADPAHTRGWIALAELQLRTGAAEDAIESCDQGAGGASEPRELAALSECQGRAFEARGERQQAAEAYGLAWECDATRADAALAQARLLRGFGDWQQAAQALARFGEAHPDRSDPTLADVYDQLGRLRAGPLEDLDGAVLSYRHAVELAPERLEARAALAELLSHRPGDRQEALEHVRAVLAAEPTHAGSLRVALRLARGQGDAERVARGVALQRALGIATAYDREADPDAALRWGGGEPALADPRFEALRLLSVEASSELARALGGSDAVAGEPGSDDPLAALRARMFALQGELSAPALLARSDSEAGEALGLLAALLLEPEAVEGDGQLVNALTGALSWRRRRRLRRLLADDATAADFARIDLAGWRVELRALAAAELLRRGEASLRGVLVALVAEPGEQLELEGESHLVPRVETEPVARALLSRLVSDWLEGL